MTNNHWNKKNLLLISIYLIGFGIGTISHAMDMVKLGFLGYTFAPFVLNVFWTSLLVLDPLVIVLLLVRFRYAITLAVLIMIFDILINLSYGVAVGNRNIILGLATQIPFGSFVFLTAKHLSRYRSIATCLKW